ncbi:DUF4168 domain-containing protein [Candidatus Synechococcus calcipolaris G9]|uniref:DUF4168 domain-containing protein n=1 Tax=Candidatus Synechococcus calcipolaris G9 TaxID=1497997 RepID=A0ABT6EY43_9SYNE|nr:DUF4168 domain-containing protein [Candidatus Synechococcus calcipolaris]MDG2990703.1 DUF4168 domain-containing protein [Candidatus Synechococcus calcipolaris G9]
MNNPWSLGKLTQGVAIALLIAVLPGVYSSLRGQSSPEPSLLFVQADVSNYARVVLEIEPIRRKYYRQAQQVVSGTVPRNSCFGYNRQNIPNGLEGICEDYLRESLQILQKYNMSLEQFNAMTQRAQVDANFSQRIQQEMLRLLQ